MLIEENKISQGHAKVLVGLDNAYFLAKKIIEKKLSVRQAESLIRSLKNSKVKGKINKNSNLLSLESGIEEKVIEQLDKNKILNFFLLDVEFPYILQNYEKYGNNLSLRFSKYEEIDTIKNFIGKVKWVWVDTYDDFNLDSEQANTLRNFNLCLVSPSRWGYENKINHYLNKFKNHDLSFEAIMVEESVIS